MNPEDNNLNPNPGTPDAGMSNEPAGDSGLNMTDGLASAQDNLTSAGLAASTGEGTMDLSQIGATAPEAVMTPPVEEPLIPAAPVPGSIGSVTSVPPLENSPADGIAPVAPEGSASVDGDAPVNSNPVAEPAPAPYNPFAHHTAPAPEPVATDTMPNPAFQPPVVPKAKKMSPLLTALIIVSAALLIAVIVLVALLIKAVNSPKIVYVPQTPNEESNARIEMLTCSRESDFARYAGLEAPAVGTETLVVSYSNNELRAASMDYAMRFDDEGAASTAQTTFASEQAEVLSLIDNSFAVNYDLNGGNLDIQITSGQDGFNPSDAAILMYGPGNGNASTSLSSIRSLYESVGYTCSVD